MLENGVLRRIFGPKREEIIGDWTKLNNEGLIFCIPHQIFFG